MPNVPIEQFVYRRRSRDLATDRRYPFAKGPAWGTAIVVYSNNQVFDWAASTPPFDENGDTIVPPDPVRLPPPQKARWACYMERQYMGSDTWNALPSQIAAPGAPDAPAPTATIPPTPPTDPPFTFEPSSTTTEQSTSPPESSSSPAGPPPIPYPTATDTVHVRPFCYHSGDGYGHVGYKRAVAAGQLLPSWTRIPLTACTRYTLTELTI